MATRTLGVAFWEYRDTAGRRRRAFYRDTFDLPASEAERGDRAAVFINGDNTPPVARSLPPKTATKAALVDWLARNREVDPGVVRGLTKAQLWQLVDEA